MPSNVNLNDAIHVRTALKVLSPGMYTVRHLGTQTSDASASQLSIPLALSQAPIQMDGDIEFICPDGITHQTLAASGDYLLLNITGGDAVLAASKYAPRALADKVDIHWRIESLNQRDSARPSQRPSQTGFAPAQPKRLHSNRTAETHPAQRTENASPMPLVQLSGHAERRGDINAAAGEWLGDPGSQARLEGLRVLWQDAPEGVELIAGCKAGEHTQQVKNGAFLGTRQQAMPITQLAACLTGRNAEHYTLSGEAAFTDGSRQPLGGPKAVHGSANSYLVAMKISITPTHTQTKPEQQAKPVRDEAAASSRSRWLDPDVTHIQQGR